MKKNIIAIVGMCAIVLTGCSSKAVVQATPMITQENLLEKCTTDTPLPEKYTLDENGKKVYNGKEVYNVLIQWENVYSECATKHDKLIDTIRELQTNRTMKIDK